MKTLSLPIHFIRRR